MPKAPKTKVSQNRKVIHPNSRKAGQLARQAHHDDRVERRKDERQRKLDVLADKLKFFQTNLTEDKWEYSKDDILEILDSYFHRFDEELEQITIVNSIGGRNGQRHASREQVIRLAQQTERSEFNTVGTEVPDLCSRKHVAVFKEWTGETKFIPNLKLRRISAKDKSSTDTRLTEQPRSDVIASPESMSPEDPATNDRSFPVTTVTVSTDSQDNIQDTPKT